MNSAPKIVNMSANLSGSGDLCATISARYAGTGRTVCADAMFGEIDVWSRLTDLGSSELFVRIQEALRSCRVVSGPSIIGFRGRSFPREAGAPSRDCFGPPPATLAPQNRYNEAGKPALYLCTDSSAVGRELPGLSNVWIQQFSVPVETLRIADLRSPEANDRQLLASLLWFAELAGAEGHCSQDFSRFVASMISKQFDGMLVSGVRGDSSFYYSNLVLFRPDDKWREWLSSELPMPFERKAV